jgi:hypothetical protein
MEFLPFALGRFSVAGNSVGGEAGEEEFFGESKVGTS